MVVDIGGGTTDVAVISMAGIVYSRSVRVAGNEMDEAIIQYIKRKYNLLIGERTAEEVKMKLGSAFPLDEELTLEIKGRDLVEGVPKTIVVSDEEIREALAETVATIIEAVRIALEQTPPELSADIVDRGIVITGGGAMLRHLQQLVRFRTGMDVRIGYPNAHLAGNVSDDINQPMFATSVGLLMRGYEFIDSEWEGPVPHTILIAPGGKIVQRWKDEIDPASLKNEIANVLGRTYASKK